MRAGPGNVDPYAASVVPSGQIDTRSASAQDFGGDGGFGALARGLGQASDTAGQISDQQFQLQNDQARIWASTAAAQTELNVRQQFADHVHSLDPTKPDYQKQIGSLTEDADSMWTDASAQLEQQAPNEMSRKQLARQLSMARVRYVGDAIGQQADLNAKYTADQVQQGTKADTDLLAASPDNDTHDRLLDARVQSIAQLQSFGPDVREKMIEEVRNTYGQVQVQSYASQQPAQFLKAINAQGGVTTARGTKGEVPTMPGSAPDDANAPVAGSVNPTQGAAVIPDSTPGNHVVGAYTPDLVKQRAAQVAAPSQYDPLINAAAAKYGVDPKELKLRAVAESGLNPTADSGPSKGIMQFTPATAAQWGVTDPNDPAQAIDGAAKMLAAYTAKAGGDMSKVDKMYYGGPNTSGTHHDESQYAANLGAVRSFMGLTAGEPQVQPLTDQQIAAANPPLSGWKDLTWAQKRSAVDQAEGLLGKNLASQRGSLTGDLEDTTAALKNGVTPPDLGDPKYSRANLTSVYGPDEGLRRFNALQSDMQGAQFQQQVGTMPAAQRAQWLDTQKPQAGPGYAGALEGYARAQAAAQNVQKQQQAQWTDYAIRAGIGGAAPLQFNDPKQLLAGLKNRQNLMITGQREFGVARSTVFSTPEVQAIGDQIDKMPAPARIGFIANMRAALTDDNAWHTAMAQIAPKNPGLVYGAQVYVKGGTSDGTPQGVPSAVVGQNIAEGDIIRNGYGAPKPGGKVGAGEDVGLPKGKGITPFNEKAFQSQFMAAVGGPAAFQTADATMSARAYQSMYNAAADYYAADAAHRGVDTSAPTPADVQAAVKATAGAQWKTANGGALFAPYGMKLTDFQDQWQPRAMAALKAGGYTDERAQWQMDHARPVNLRDGQYGLMIGTRTVTGADGRPVVIDYGNNLSPATVVPSAATASAAPAGIANELSIGK